MFSRIQSIQYHWLFHQLEGNHSLSRSKTQDRLRKQNDDLWIPSHHFYQFFDGCILRDGERSKFFIPSFFSIHFHFEGFVFRSNRIPVCLFNEMIARRTSKKNEPTVEVSDGSTVRLKIRFRNKCGVLGNKRSCSELRMTRVSVVLE